jgi:hypothetical protein
MSSTQHEAVLSARPRRRTLRWVLVTAAIFAAAIGVSLGASGTTYALWNGSAPVAAAAITTATTGLTVNNVSGYTVPGMTVTQLLPGTSVVSPQPMTVKNNGTIPLSVVPAAPVFADPNSVVANNLAVVLVQGSTCVASIDGSTSPGWTTPLVLNAGQSVSVCLQISLSATAPSSVQGASAAFNVPLIGNQVHS